MTYTDILERLTYSELEELRDYLQDEEPHGILIRFVEQEMELRAYVH